MEITAQMVKTLRDKTNAGMMDCKKALAECGGDLEKSVDWLRQKGLMTARKRAGRATREGLVLTALSSDAKKGAIVELNTETDFVAKMDSFRELTLDLADYLITTDNPPKDVAEFLTRKSEKRGAVVSELINSAVGTTGELMNLRRFALFSSKDGFVHTYIHAGGRLGVMVELKVEKPGPEADDLAHNIAMHVAAASPVAVKSDDLPSDLLDREKALYRAKAQESGKPEKIWDKIIEGQLKKFFSEVVLLEQPYVKEPAKNIGQILKEAKATVGEAQVLAFVRFQLGEELEGESNEE